MNQTVVSRKDLQAHAFRCGNCNALILGFAASLGGVVTSELLVMKGNSTTARLCSVSCIRVLATDVEISASRLNRRQTMN